jgi:Cu+-exporting ATPase
MNGVLAGMQAAGMPMRPAASALMGLEVAPVRASDAGIDVGLAAPAELRAGEAARLVVRLSEDGNPLTALGRVDDAWMHLVLIRSDASEFLHVHPEPGAPGELEVDVVLPREGTYLAFAEFRRRGELGGVLADTALVVGGVPSGVGTLVEDRAPKTVAGVEVELMGDLVAGEESELMLRFTEAATGRPVDDLRPYLAAAAHVVVVAEDGSGFVHTHAGNKGSEGMTAALPGQTFGPDLAVHLHVDRPGPNKLWVQFRTPSGDVATVPFVLVAR